MFVILFSSLGNCFRSNRPSTSGYTRAGGDERGGFIGAIGGRGGGQGGRRDVDAENRLIDQLDEEWDD
jgi:Predicted membrane protein